MRVAVARLMAIDRHPRYGKGEYHLPSDTANLSQEEARLRDWLEAYLRKPMVELPRPPAVALEVLKLSSRPTARIEDIAALLEREPLLAGRVLKLANSASYGATTPCVTLKQALVRMGLSLVRDVVMEAAMQMTALHAEGFNETLESVRRHSVAIAWVSRFVARNTSMEAENAFLAGLLHDVGLSIAVIAVAQFQRAERRPMTLSLSSWLAAQAVHASFSAQVLELWELPVSMQVLAANHHSLVVDGREHPGVAVLMVADQISDELGWGIVPRLEREEELALVHDGTERVTRDEVERALGVLRLDLDHYQRIRQDMVRVLATLKNQFDRPGAAGPP
jgi:HD-like signal output (HDOD) protein